MTQPLDTLLAKTLPVLNLTEWSKGQKSRPEIQVDNNNLISQFKKTEAWLELISGWLDLFVWCT